jgi:hypothetical protein
MQARLHIGLKPLGSARLSERGQPERMREAIELQTGTGSAGSRDYRNFGIEIAKPGATNLQNALW